MEIFYIVNCVIKKCANFLRMLRFALIFSVWMRLLLMQAENSDAMNPARN